MTWIFNLTQIYTQGEDLGRLQQVTLCCGQLWVRHMFCGQDL